MTAYDHPQHYISLYILIYSMMTIIHTTAQITTINTNIWQDDFDCVSGWNDCTIHSITGSYKQYHGSYNDIDSNDLSTKTYFNLNRQFACSYESDMFISFVAAFDCTIETAITDTITLSINSAMISGLTLSDQSLPNYQGQCNNNQPWLLQISPIYNISVTNNEIIQLNWQIISSDIDHQMLIYNISIQCINNNPTNSPTNTPTYDPTKMPSFNPTRTPTMHPTYNPTYDPTSDPTSDPTTDPTYDPTTDPTADPTQDPTYDPIGILTDIWSTSEDTRFIHDP
eukprot:512674_1